MILKSFLKQEKFSPLRTVGPICYMFVNALPHFLPFINTLSVSTSFSLTKASYFQSKIFKKKQRKTKRDKQTKHLAKHISCRCSACRYISNIIHFKNSDRTPVTVKAYLSLLQQV